MYRKKPSGQLEFEEFYHPFGGKLSSDNRWVKLSKLLPWEEIERRYEKSFSQKMGAPAKPLRMALGALIIKERCGFTDEETVEQIRENPYLQYFIGLKAYTDEAPFNPSTMVYFRMRIGLEIIDEINEMIVTGDRRNDESNIADPDNDDENNVNDGDNGGDNNGKLIIDATCTPADIRYPTDLSSLNEGREKLEKIIDVLHEPLKGKEKKPRTYRQKARKAYLKTAKKRKRTQKEIRKAIGKQLGYVSRDLRHVEELVKRSSLELLSRYQYKCLLVIQELYRQQKKMYDAREHSVENRIVSISQPHIRPIVRGKVSAPTEFGAKISLSPVDGFARIEKFSWETFNESTTLQEEIERYKSRHGFYPVSVHVDKIYRTRRNIGYCKKNNIRISGPPLGRPRKDDNEELRIKQEKQDLRERVLIEGKIGEGKRRYSMARIMAKLPDTSESVIGIIFLVMNLEKKLRLLFVRFLLRFVSRNLWRHEGLSA
ncbi:MAG TPA: IS5 family transposase [Bacteroidetes bacterium]|nr:IS5 family transposase [Bacteroidota bacterium]